MTASPSEYLVFDAMGIKNLTRQSTARAKRTMSAQSRYRTLVANTGAIYAANQEGRTALLEKGLYEIVGGIQPTNADQWNLVKTDSERLLKVWFSKEKEQGPAADEVVSQLLDLLKELATPPPPTLLIADVKADKITHIHDFPQRRLPTPVPTHVPTPVSVHVQKEVPLVQVIEEVEVEESEEEVVIEESEEEVIEEESEEEAEAEEEEAEEEAEEEVEEEAEEEGMEVEQIFIRGRTYWLDSNTQQLYANAEGDEVGEEVGKMVDGKPVFLSK